MPPRAPSLRDQPRFSIAAVTHKAPLQAQSGRSTEYGHQTGIDTPTTYPMTMPSIAPTATCTQTRRQLCKMIQVKGACGIYAAMQYVAVRSTDHDMSTPCQKPVYEKQTGLRTCKGV